MIAVDTPFASGDWIVTSGSEQEFIKRWTEFLEWTRSNFPECVSAQLIHQAENSRHFISVARWENAEALQRWRSRPEFAQKIGACRALCEDFRGGDYTLAAAV